MPETKKIAWDDSVSTGQTVHDDIVIETSRSPLPFLVWVILISTGAALLGGEGILGYRVSGLAWFIPLLFSVLTILKNPGRVSFPLKIWMPWILLLIIYFFVFDYHVLQRTVQLICPVVVGMAVSTLNIKSSQVKSFITRFKPFSTILILIALWHTGTLVTGIIPSVTGLSPHSLTALIFCSFFAANYVSGNEKDLYWWVMMIGVPIFAVTRTAIAVAGLTLPLTFAPMKFKKRTALIIVGLMLSLALFQTERIQKKMFRSDSGTLEDIQSQNLDDTGRKFMWKMMRYKIRKNPWLGYGTGSGEVFTRVITGGISGYPHNDWLLTLHDQGILGTTIFAISMLMATLNALRTGKTASPEVRLLFFTGASAFLSMALMMITDNIMIYASYFGNLHFTILGIAYAAEKTSTANSKRITP
ncbi:O-antigen ligase family protein [Thermodesulfobacteriota bacterium]